MDIKCSKCGSILSELSHKGFLNTKSFIFKVKCINRECEEFDKKHFLMEIVISDRTSYMINGISIVEGKLQKLKV